MIIEPDWNSWGVGSAVPKDIRAEIGSVVIFQGSIEYELRDYIAALAGVPTEIMDAATSEMSYRQLMALLSSLAIRRIGKEGPIYEDFAQITAAIDKFEAFRNSVAHAHWSHSIEDMTRQDRAARHKSTAKRGRGLLATVVEFTLPEFELQLKKAAFYQAELYKLLQRVLQGPV